MKSLFIFVLIFTLFTLIGCGVASTSPMNTSAEEFNITSPESNYIFTNEQVNIYAAIPVGLIDQGSLDAEVSIEGPDEKVVLAQGDLRSFNSDGSIVAIWDPSDYALGSYLITVIADINGKSYEKTKKVELRNPPSISVYLEDSMIQGDRIITNFIAEATTEPPAEIASYRWYFGNGASQVGEGLNSVTYEYRRIEAEYDVSVEVIDNFGGTNYGIYTIALTPEQEPPGFFQIAKKPCGCKFMLLDARSKIKSTRYKGPITPGIAGLQMVQPPNRLDLTDPIAAKPGKQLLRADLGNLDPVPNKHNQLGIGFEVEAFLLGGSDPASCKEGQYARGTITRNNAARSNANSINSPKSSTGTLTLPLKPGANGIARSFKINTSNGKPYPKLPARVMGPSVTPDPLNFGGDDYAKIGNVKKYTVGTKVISWVDVPQVPTVQGIKQEDTREFISYVMGDKGKGTCWCHFETHRTIDQKGATGGRGLTLIQGLNCNIRK